MKNKLNILFACLYLLTNVLSAGQVVCYGADGHNSIERVHLTNHCPTSHDNHETHDHDHESHSHEEITEIADHCEPCSDTPLQDDAKLIDQDQPSVDLGIYETSSLVVVKVEFDSVLINNFPPQQLCSNQILDSLRTIILII